MTDVMPRWLDIGGPLIVLPTTLLPFWRGADGVFPEADDDYGRACAVNDFAAVICVGEGQALVLGDEPAMTCYLPAHRVFVRWIAADSPEALLDRAGEVLADPTTEWRDCGTWVTDGPAVLMGAVYGGSELNAPDAFGDRPAHTAVPIPAGQWSVRVTYDDRAPRTWAVIVRLDPR